MIIKIKFKKTKIAVSIFLRKVSVWIIKIRSKQVGGIGNHQACTKEFNAGNGGNMIELQHKGFTPMPRKGKSADPQVVGANEDQPDDCGMKKGV